MCVYVLYGWIIKMYSEIPGANDHSSRCAFKTSIIIIIMEFNKKKKKKKIMNKIIKFQTYEPSRLLDT